MNNLSFLLYIVVFLSTSTYAQITSDAYWDASHIADTHYQNADYHAAAKAYEVLWTKPNEEDIASDRLHAAAANCMIDNEEGVKKNLFKMIPVANKTYVKRVLVNYEIFNKYKETDWWQELETGLNQRIADLIAHHKNLRIFKKGRNVLYSAIRINAKGDTLANTTLNMIPDGTGWGDEAADSQSQVIYVYESSTQDSIDHIEEVEMTVGTRFWNDIDTTGVGESESKVWIHPFRNNEFFKTEIAPFPEVYFPLSDSLMQSKKSSTHIMNNWGLYTGTETKQSYNYIGKENKSYQGIGKIECHKLKAIADNTRHGQSTLEYFFHEEYGFTEMNYLTYDGDIIQFKIIGINYTD